MILLTFSEGIQRFSHWPLIRQRTGELQQTIMIYCCAFPSDASLSEAVAQVRLYGVIPHSLPSPEFSLGGAQWTLEVLEFHWRHSVPVTVKFLRLPACFCRTLANRMKYVRVRKLPPKTASLSFNLRIEKSGLRGKGPKWDQRSPFVKSLTPNSTEAPGTAQAFPTQLVAYLVELE